MMKILCNVLAYSMVTGITVFATEVHEFNISNGDVALHNDQIFIKQNGEWMSIGGVASDGRFYASKKLSPLMSRCSRVEIEWDYANGKLIFSADRDPENRDDESEDRQSDERHDPPDSRDHAERDHKD